MKPIEMNFQSASTGEVGTIATFNSYNFMRSILTPASAFRFTAPGIDKATRQKIRSGDVISLYAYDSEDQPIPLASGFIDETDTHVIPGNIEYVLTGRDTLGALVDNDSVDAQNRIINTTQVTLPFIVKKLLENTRVSSDIIEQQVPNGTFLFQTNPGETKITAIQRYLEFTNTLLWTSPDGRLILGKPDFTQESSGKLILRSDSRENNCLEARVRRNTNQAIRQIVTQLQGLEQVDADPFTIQNDDEDLKKLPGVGRSLYRTFSYGSGNDTVNTLSGAAVGGSPYALGKQFSLREIARDNVRILDVEIVVRGHLNSSGGIYNIDQVYDVDIEDDDVNEPLYVYSCTYELTLQHGMLTRLRLCRLNTICASSAAL